MISEDIIVNNPVDIFFLCFLLCLYCDRDTDSHRPFLAGGGNLDIQHIDSPTAPRRRVSAEDVAARVISLIEAREFQPGDRLREQELADRFEVSRGPVREALRILEAKSIVHIEPMRGATITRLSDQEAREAVDISALLFGHAARRASEKRSAADMDVLRARLVKLEDMLGDGTSPKEFFQQTLRLGYGVLRASESDRLRRLVEDVRFGAPTYFGPMGFSSHELRREALSSWQKMIEAIEERDGDTAERLGRKVHDDAMQAALQVVG
jgi:DNA-binding GntR family transcriptional regulator